VLVSLPEELPVNETIDLDAALRKRVHVVPRVIVLNAFVPPRFDEADLAQLGPELAAVARNHFARAKASAESRDRLKKALGLPVTTVPRLFVERFGRAAIEKIADALAVLTESG